MTDLHSCRYSAADHCGPICTPAPYGTSPRPPPAASQIATTGAGSATTAIMDISNAHPVVPQPFYRHANNEFNRPYMLDRTSGQFSEGYYQDRTATHARTTILPLSKWKQSRARWLPPNDNQVRTWRRIDTTVKSRH